MRVPLYTAENCRNPAYQLDWSYSVFCRTHPCDFAWLEELRRLNEPDGIRILQHQFEEPGVSQFLISTRPTVAPRTIAQRVKGRLQHLVCDRMPKTFQRNYSLRSIGSTHREKLAQSLPQQTSHARYWYNLHVVLVNECRYREIRDHRLMALRNMIRRAADAKGHRLSRAAIVPDHIHLALGCKLEEPPEQVVLGYLNNLAFTCGMKPVFRFGYYVGTFSEYDLGVIPRA